MEAVTDATGAGNVVEETVSLYRAVKPEELADIQQRTPGRLHSCA